MEENYVNWEYLISVEPHSIMLNAWDKSRQIGKRIDRNISQLIIKMFKRGFKGT